MPEHTFRRLASHHSPMRINKREPSSDTGRMAGVSEPSNPSADDRAARVVRAAIRAYLDGVTASDWLVSPSAALDGRSPLSVAKESEEGCARVCAALEAARSTASPG